jgi:hypothetical protein
MKIPLQAEQQIGAQAKSRPGGTVNWSVAQIPIWRGQQTTNHETITNSICKQIITFLLHFLQQVIFFGFHPIVLLILYLLTGIL